MGFKGLSFWNSLDLNQTSEEGISFPYSYLRAPNDPRPHGKLVSVREMTEDISRNPGVTVSFYFYSFYFYFFPKNLKIGLGLLLFFSSKPLLVDFGFKG